MGNNIINMARFLNFQVHAIESKHPKQSEFLAVNMPKENVLSLNQGKYGRITG